MQHVGTLLEYALKVVDKQLVLRHKVVERVRAERDILDRCAYAGIVRLKFTFQDTANLYFGLELLPNGASATFSRPGLQPYVRTV